MSEHDPFPIQGQATSACDPAQRLTCVCERRPEHKTSDETGLGTRLDESVGSARGDCHDR